MTSPRLLGGTVLALVALAGFGLPRVVADAHLVDVAGNGVILGILALCVAFLLRHLGWVTFGIAGFYGAGAYAFGIASTHWALAPTPAAVVAVGLTLALSLVVGALIVRSNHLAFAMLTLGIGQLLRELAVQSSVRPLTGGDDGLVLTLQGSLAGVDAGELLDPMAFWGVAWAALLICVTTLWLVGRSGLGQVLAGIRENEERMRFSGFGTFAPRLAAFAIASTIAGLAGILKAVHAGFVSPDMLDFSTGGNAIVAALVGGVGAIAGPVAGGVLFVAGQDTFGAGGQLKLLTGLAVIVTVAFFRQGLAGLVSAGLRAVRRRTGSEQHAGG